MVLARKAWMRDLSLSSPARLGFWFTGRLPGAVAWRREWDSNPRYGFPHTRFPSVRLKPLGHLSGAPSLEGAPKILQGIGGKSGEFSVRRCIFDRISHAVRHPEPAERVNQRLAWRDDSRQSLKHAEDAMTIRKTLAVLGLFSALGSAFAGSAGAQVCTRQGVEVSCDDGRRGVLSGDAIIWPDGTRSSTSPHQSVIIGNKSSVHVGPGVFVGQGKGMAPLDDPNAPNKRQCAILEGVSYCY